MLAIATKVVNQANEQIDIQVSVTAPSGSPGIASVTVTAIDKSVIDEESLTDCPGDYTFFVKGIPFASLPAYIEAKECVPGVDQGQATPTVTSIGPLFRDVIGIADCKPPGQNQNNQVCIKLQNSIQELRNTIFIQCEDAANIRDEIKNFSILAAATALIFAILLLASAMAPWPVNLIIGIVAAGFGVASIVFITLAQMKQKDLNKILTKIAVARWTLKDLVARLNDVCCPEFITVTRDVPVC